TGLTIGKAGNTATVSFDRAESIAGPITVYGGNINVNQNLASTSSGSAIQLLGNNTVTMAASKAITSNNGHVSLITKGDIFGNTGASISSGTGNILLAADSDATGAGAIGLTGTSLTATGGNITLGGGNALGTGYAEGSGTVFADATHRGVWLQTSTLNAGGGNISIKGKGWQGAGSAVMYSIGVDIVTGTTIQTSGAGTITIDGVGGVNTDNNSHSTGINFYAPSASNNIFSGSGAISITGTASPSLLSGRVHGGINLDFGPTQIYATSGGITLRGVGTSSDKGISVLTGSTLYVGRKSDGTVTTSGNIRLKSNSFNWTGTGVVAGTGSLTIEPDTNGTTMGIGSGAGTLNLANSLFSGTSVFKDGFSSIILGSSSAGNLTVGGTNNFVDNVSMVTGGNLTLNSGATVATTQASGYIALAATGNFINNTTGTALTAPGRWLVYSAAPTNNVFGTLNSANAPVWNASFDTMAPSAVAVTGNRYLFTGTPSVTVTAGATKVYGTALTTADVLGLSSNSGSSSVYTLPTLADVFSVNPTVAP
ncbi:MAG: hypothetical protein EB125_09750, partial [Betaproteobacteria bacterium]|nr:hypothetical protein [Betaproteobacteria bacterium]